MASEYVLGSVVPLTFLVYDENGDAANAGGYTITVTKPDGSTETPSADNSTVGQYLLDYLPGSTGWFQVRFVGTGVNAGAQEVNFYVRPASLNRVLLADVKTYLGTDHTWDDAQIQQALDAERSAQAKVCDIDEYNPDLREALYRRVHRNLAARAVPVTSFIAGDGGGTSIRVPSRDPEIARLEGPYRKWVMA